MIASQGGGPAFPGENTGDSYNHGMSLRDWFAGQAITRLVQAHSTRDQYPVVAKLAYELADALLEARRTELETEKPKGAVWGRNSEEERKRILAEEFNRRQKESGGGDVV